jgi:hypothetical protein
MIKLNTVDISPNNYNHYYYGKGKICEQVWENIRDQIWLQIYDKVYGKGMIITRFTVLYRIREYNYD